MASRNGQTSTRCGCRRWRRCIGMCPPAHGSNVRRPWARDAQNRQNPSVGNRLGVNGEDEGGSQCGKKRAVPLGARRRRWCRLQRRHQLRAGCLEGGSGSDAPYNVACLRPHCERRGEAVTVILPVGGGVPIQGSWGSALHHRSGEEKPDMGGPAGYRSPTVGKPVTVPASRSACGICGRPACGKKPRRQQRFIPRTRGSTPGHHSCSGACVRRSLSGCPPGVPAVEAPIQGSSLRPCSCFPLPE